MPTANEIEFTSQPAVITPGAILQGRYRIVRQLGRGGMGAVYEAVDERLDTTVALKETFSVDVRLRRQFEQEARLLAQLHHQALPKVTDYFTEGDRAFLVMQFISGVDLAEIIARQPGPFPRHQVVAWADQLLDALIYLHTRDRQVIHRDIKPHNLKLTSSGQIALLDFGLAKAQSLDAGAANSSLSIFGYTRRYAPLEQIQDQGTTPQSDIYALGATLYHLLTGIKPPDALARAAAHVNSRPDPLRPADEIHAAVGPEIASILCRAMAQNPDERYASASDFREALWRLGRNKARLEEFSEIDAPEPVIVPSPAAAEAPVGKFQQASLAVCAGFPGSDPFNNYSILKPDASLQLPAPPERLTNVYARVMLGFIAVGLIIAVAYQSWSEPVNPAKAAIEAKVALEQRPVVAIVGRQSKPDKSHANTPVSGGPRASVGEPSRTNDEVDRRPAIAESTEAKAADSASPKQLEPRPKVDVRHKLNIPSPRLPSADWKTNDPTPSMQRLPDYATERQVLRAGDGTQVVKFSDGTTRVFRPGEKSQTGAPK